MTNPGTRGQLVLARPSQDYDPQQEAVFRSQIELAMVEVRSAIDELRISPQVFDVLISFAPDGSALLDIKCNADTLSFKYAVSPIAPVTAEQVRLEGVQAGSKGTFTVVGPFQPGETLHVGVLPYAGEDADGTEGPLYQEAATYAALIANECRAVVIAATDTTISVRVTATANTIGAPTVTLASLTGATINSGLAVLTPGASPQTWVFNRPAAMAGEGRALFTARFADALDDRDAVIIPEQGTNLLFLGVRASVIEVQPRTAIVRIAAVDPIPQGANTVDLDYSMLTAVTLDPVSPQTVTPAAVYSGAAGTYLDVEVPLLVNTINRLTVRAESNAASRIPDEDLVTLPGRAGIPASLEVLPEYTATDCSISWEVGDTDLAEVSINGGAFTPLADAGTVVVARQAWSGGSDQFYTYRSTGELGDIKTQTVIVVRQDVRVPGLPAITSISMLNGLFNCDGSGQFDISWTVADMPGTETYEVEWEVLEGFFLAASSGTVSLATSPETISADLCDTVDSPRARVTVYAYDGADLIAQFTQEALIGT
jgi:hypothetical protein